jgi:hypothetical protein
MTGRAASPERGSLDAAEMGRISARSWLLDLERRIPARDRFAPDSPLEEAVTSEPVSETRLFPGAFQNQISVGFGCYQQRKAPFRLEFAGNRTAFPGGRPHYSILFPSIRARARARPATENPLPRAAPRREFVSEAKFPGTVHKLGSDIRCVLDDTVLSNAVLALELSGCSSSPRAAGPRS